MFQLRTTVSRSFSLAQKNRAAPVAAFLPHWARSFSNSPQGLNEKPPVLKSAPGWDPALATESEADVKADREPLPADVEELQNETVKIISDTEGHLAKDRINTDFVKEGEKIMEKIIHRAEKAGADLGKTAGTVKSKVERAEGEVKEDVLSDAQKVSSFVKGSIETVKKTIGIKGGKA